ncbi:MAG: sterol desaturase family protein, partial [Pseudomonadota bacterium]
MPGGIPIEALFAPIFVISVAVEWWSVKTGRASGRYETADALTSMAMGLGNAIIGTLTGVAALWIMMLAWPYRVMTMPTTWWSFLIVFVLYDLVYYWKHRFAHRVR